MALKLCRSETGKLKISNRKFPQMYLFGVTTHLLYLKIPIAEGLQKHREELVSVLHRMWLAVSSCC